MGTTVDAVTSTFSKTVAQQPQYFMQQATYKGSIPCVLNQEFLFFGSRVLGFRSDPSWLKYWLLRD